MDPCSLFLSPTRASITMTFVMGRVSSPTVVDVKTLARGKEQSLCD